MENGSPIAIFRKWSRKSYALFSVIGKEVHIGHLSIDLASSGLVDLSTSDVEIEVVDSFLESNIETDLTFLELSDEVEVNSVFFPYFI